jgi:pimeloyl-ACP methyl ester carboxylesterase
MVGRVSDQREIVTGGIRLAYRVAGDPGAPPLVLLHALGENSTDWAGVTGPLAASFRVFALDLRGHGASDWPGTYSFRLMRDDVIGALDGLGLDRITLVGHSMGGVVAYLIAEEQPDRVDRLVVEDVPPPFPRDRPPGERPAGPLDFDWAVVPAIIGQVNRGDDAAWARLGDIAAPTLLIGGGEASHIPQDKLTAVAARIPDCQLVTIPAGHEVHTSRPAEFTRAVLGWLRPGPAA